VIGGLASDMLIV